ncbi:flavodoxin [Treponema parvum]|uniref:Flavodoxin n=2 Tax=Treponema parvum TaxID=138851 RepID=A0A975F1Z3_9SPIR|nr:flavodoxin [Treponema parvum]
MLTAALAVLLPIITVNGAANLFAQTTLSGAKKDAKILVAYFSRADENYNVGVIEKGNTQILAEFIADELKADTFRIQTVTPYPKAYKACTDTAMAEQKKKARPKLAGTLPNLSEYDIIFLGYPIWWGDLPMAVYTFLEGGDFAGKTIIPFCTHEGSGDAGTARRIESACPKAKVLPVFSMRGQTAQRSQDAAKRDTLKWLGGIKLN